MAVKGAAYFVRLFRSIAAYVTMHQSSCRSLGSRDPKTSSFTNSIGMQFTRIDAGQFTMGQGDSPPRSRLEWNEREFDEAPAHKVNISKSFYLGIHEVTNAQYEAFDPKHKERLRGAKRGWREEAAT